MVASKAYCRSHGQRLEPQGSGNSQSQIEVLHCEEAAHPRLKTANEQSKAHPSLKTDEQLAGKIFEVVIGVEVAIKGASPLRQYRKFTTKK
jgi:hypothetical protein